MDKKLIESKMIASVNHFSKEINGLRTGRASTALVESILVESYGSPEARLITIQVWDNSLIKSVEKAIMDSDLGINPQTDGNLIRLSLPNIDEERRKELSKIASKYAEDNKISIRNTRRDSIDSLKKDQKDGNMNEDELKKSMDEVQKITDKFINQIDSLLKSKQEEIMKV